MKTKDTISKMIIFILLSFATINADFSPPLPEPGTATIDGNYGEWDLTLDYFADMREAGDFTTPKTLLSKAYLRYDCSTQTLYILVINESGFFTVNSANDNWVKEYSLSPPPTRKIVDGNGTFSYIYEGQNIIGYEASGTIAPGSYTQLEIHTQISGSGGRTSSTGKGPYIALNLDCGVLPVEMTSFSVNLENNAAELLWETATEINNYGFEVQRTSNNEKWKILGFVNGHGNSNSPKFYSYKDKDLDVSGKYSYRLKQIDINGTFEYSDVIETESSTPQEYKLNQNYPNPFNPTTTISYSIPEHADVKIIIYSIFGEEVRTLLNDRKEAGTYSINFNAENLASGIYFYTIETGKYFATKKFTLLK